MATDTAPDVEHAAGLSKQERHRLIRSVIAAQPVSTQLELVQALDGLGCAVTQATVSRDIRELDLQKGRDAFGRRRYQLSTRDRPRDPEGALGSVLGQFGREVVPAGQLLVLRLDIGTAPTIGRAVDNLDDARIAGTVAGDDTLLVICRTTDQAGDVAAYLEGFLT